MRLQFVQLSDEALVAAGVNQSFVRLAVGIEGIDDIIADLETGFAAAKAAAAASGQDTQGAP